MNLSNTAQYAIRIMAYIAANKEKMFSAQELIERLNISDKYLRRIMTELAKTGLINSIKGRNGGYSLAKKPEEIFLNQIIDAVDDSHKYEGCILGFQSCSDENPCALHNEWHKIKSQIIKLFEQTSLKQIINGNHIGRF